MIPNKFYKICSDVDLNRQVSQSVFGVPENVFTPSYSRCIRDARLVANRISNDYDLEIKIREYSDPKKRWTVTFGECYSADDDELPKAICLAAIIAIKGIKHEENLDR